MSGTSMACPEAAGIVALILEANPALRPADLKRVLQITAKRIPDVVFYRQGYGNADPAGAVALARRLAGQPASDVDRILDEQQAARDAEILAAMPHPLRTTAWTQEEPTPTRRARRPNRTARRAHTITVEPGAGRIKVVNAGFGLPFVADPLHTIIVRDAAGREVGRSPQRMPGGSSTTVADLDLTKLTGLAWGKWTVEVSEAGLVPVDTFGAPRSRWRRSLPRRGSPTRCRRSCRSRRRRRTS